MYNTYIGSAVFALRTKGSLSISFNDYSNLLTERFDKNPSLSQRCSCCNYCSCCSSSFPTQIVPLNPSLFFGLRQSTLIQWSPCKRLIFGGRDQYYYRVPDFSLDHGCFDVSCSLKERSSGKRIERRRNSRVGRLNLHERRCLSSSDDAEAVISFLSEEVSREYLGDRDGYGSFSTRVEMEKRSNNDGDKKKKKKNPRLGSWESDSKSQFESGAAELKKEGHRRKDEREEHRRREEKEQKKKYSDKEREEKEERKTVARAENCRERKASSSFSSYYSLSSTGDFESDKEAQYEHIGSLEGSLNGYKKSRSGEDNFEGGMVEEFEMHKDVGQGKFLEQRTRTDADWELRKKTEKKLTEIEETHNQKEASELHLGIVRSSESDSGSVSSSYKQIGNKNGEFTLKVNFEKGAGKQYSQTGGQVVQQSQFRRKFQELTDVNAEKTSQYQRQFISGEEDLIVDVNLDEEKRGGCHETVNETTENRNIRGNTLQLTEISEMGNVVGRNSNLRRQSESRMKIREEDIGVTSSWEEREKRLQGFEQITGHIESTRGSQQLSETSEVHDKNSTMTATLQSETGKKNQEGSTFFLPNSAEETKEQSSHADKKAVDRIHSRKRSEDVTNIAVNVTNVSLVHASDIRSVSNSQVTSEKKMIDQGSESTAVMNPPRDARERDNRTNESIYGVKLRNEANGITEVSSFQEKNSQEASRSDAPPDMLSQAQLQQITVTEGDYRSPQPIMIPPSHQVVDRGSLRVDPTSWIAGQKIPGETSESGSGALYTYSEGRTPTSQQGPYSRDRRDAIYGEPLKVVSAEDAIASAYGLEESSSNFVGEFMEMARNDVLTSGIQNEKVSDAKLEYEDEKDKRKISSQYAYERLHRMELDSRRPSGGSGEGPSDEMWDVMDPSAQEPPATEAPEESTNIKNTIVRRTGKSLWSILSDIVQLRWGSRVETPNSVKRSGGKILSNDSASSEAWFSGHDPEEVSDKNVERERRSTPKEATSSSHSQQCMQASFQGQGEVSDASSSKHIIGQLEANVSSPSSLLKSGLTSKGISTPSEEEVGKSFERTQSQDGKSCYVSSPSADAGESSSLPVPSGDMNTLIVEESYGRGRADASVSSSMEMMEQPVSANLTEAAGSEGKDGELKRRRLQWNKQVVRDKFDEWEEAYLRESEQRRIDEMFMREALIEAKKAADTWEVPVGAVLVQRGKIIARGCNLVEELRDSTAHAEMICIREASNQLRTWRLAECTLYVTLEPCPMCAGAILQARIDTVVWGAPNKLLGADGSWIRLFPNTGEGGKGLEVTDKPAAPPHPFHPKMTIRRGILASECADAMQQFFQLRRRRKVKNEDLPRRPSLPLASRQSKFLQRMHNIFHALLCI